MLTQCLHEVGVGIVASCMTVHITQQLPTQASKESPGSHKLVLALMGGVLNTNLLT